MDIRIGVTYSTRELELELPDDTDVEALRAAVEEAVDRATGMFWITDRRGRRAGVAADKLGWIEIGSGADKSRIGFGG